MTYSDLIEHFGTQTEIARAVGLEQPSISYWRANGIPEQRQLQIHKITGGKLKADPEILRKYRDLLRAA